MRVELHRVTWLWWIKNQKWKIFSRRFNDDNLIKINFTYHHWIPRKISYLSTVWIFKILFRSRVMSYDSFFEKHFYDSHMTHNIWLIHIIRLEILFLIQWCKNFWDLPTQNFSTIFCSRMRGRTKILTSNSNSA